ncbi:MAG TPA: hypothetical protein VLB27_12370, partial [candidate division Zixibacteria bacterium]|nr:hypothetical protein [candidate division Zixibacteria bacterium]
MRVDQRKFWMPLLAALCIGGCGAAEVEGGAEYRAVVQQALDAMNAHDMGALRATFGETYVRHCQATPDEVNSVD